MIPRRKPRLYSGELSDILKLLFSGRVSRGEYVDKFETEFAGYIGTRFAFMTCSGRKGLELILDALRLETNDEILMPAYTLKDLVFLIRDKGFAPRLVDVEPDSFNIDPRLIEKSITPRTKAILATHIFGLSCNIERISAIAARHDLKVIEDCAHGLGAKYKGKLAGSYGHAAFFSFETPKLINCFGGGMVTTNDEVIAARLRRSVAGQSSTCGIIGKLFLNYLEYLLIISPVYPLMLMAFMFEATSRGISRLYLSAHNKTRIRNPGASNLQALMGLRQLAALEKKNAMRNAKARELIVNLPAGVSAQTSSEDPGRVFYFLVVKLYGSRDIDQIRRRLLLRGIDAGIKGEITDNCAQFEGPPAEFPVSTGISASTLLLPLFDGLTASQMHAITRELNAVIKNA